MNDLRELLVEARSFLEQRWIERFEERGEALPSPLSRGMCRFSALFLCEVLQARGEGVWRVVGGEPTDALGRSTPSGGVRDTEGRWQGHYWVVDDESGLLVDVAADQFGQEAVRIFETPHEAYDANYTRFEVDEHLVHVRDRVDGWLVTWLGAASPTP